MIDKTFVEMEVFKIFRKDLIEVLESAELITNPKDRREFYFRESRHYGHIAQIDGLREEASIISKYLLARGEDL